MYCKQCGAEIADDSIYCSKCGNAIQKEIQQSQNKKRKINPLGCGCAIILLIPILIYAFLFVSAQLFENGVMDIVSQEATTNDVYITYETDIKEMSIKIIIIPYKDINNLKIRVATFDKDDYTIFDRYEYFGNVRAGEKVERKISLLQYFDKIIEFETIIIEVTEGRVPHLQ